MIDPTLIELLRCPETFQTVRLAESGILTALNRQIAAGAISNRAGKPIRESLEGGLLRADGRWLYPIRQNIPVMLIEEAIPVAAADAASA